VPPRHRGPAWAEGEVSVLKHGVAMMLLLARFGWVKATSPLMGPECFRVGPDAPYATRGECETELAQQADWLESVLKQKGSPTERRGVVFLTRIDGTLYTREFVCLADTVDPRGPKGK
jgi:hypothetical protein